MGLLLSITMLIAFSAFGATVTIRGGGTVAWSAQTINPGDAVVVKQTTTLNIDVAVAVCASVTLGEGNPHSGTGSLTFSSGNKLIVNGAITLGSGGYAGSVDLTGGELHCHSFVVGTLGTWTPGTGTLVMSATNIMPTGLATFNNFTDSTGTTTLGVTTTFNGAVAINSGGTLAAGANNVLIAKDFTINGSFTSTGGITLNGTALQTVTGASGTWSALTVNNNAGVLLPGLSVTSLTLTNGVVTESGTLTTANAITRTNGYINGVLEHDFTGNGSYLFAVGNTGYAPVTVNVTAGTGKASVNAHAGAPPGISNPADALARYWSINAVSGITADLIFNYPGTDVPGTATEASWAAGNWDGHSWVTTPLTGMNTTTHTGTLNGVSSFTNSDWTLGGPIALPIEVSSLNAREVAGNTVTLDWATVTETNNLGFYVERRPQGSKTYAVISGLIAGAGTSLDQHSYSFVDQNVAAGTYYYRLRQIDQNGVSSYNPEIKIVVAGVLGVKDNQPFVFRLNQNYPNPFNPATKITFELPNQGSVTLSVYNAIGQKIASLVNNATMTAGRHEVNFDASKLSSGLYFYRITMNSGNNRYDDLKKMTFIK